MKNTFIALILFFTLLSCGRAQAHKGHGMPGYAKQDTEKTIAGRTVYLPCEGCLAHLPKVSPPETYLGVKVRTHEYVAIIEIPLNQGVAFAEVRKNSTMYIESLLIRQDSQTQYEYIGRNTEHKINTSTQKVSVDLNEWLHYLQKINVFFIHE